jgi:hypothetical protein
MHPFDHPYSFIVTYKTDGYQDYLCHNPEVTSGANIYGVVAEDEIEDFPWD